MAREYTFTDAYGEEHRVAVLETAKDVTPDILAIAEETFDNWFDDDEPIDWESFIDRMADPNNHHGKGAYDFEEYDNPAVRKIQRHIRKIRREG